MRAMLRKASAAEGKILYHPEEAEDSEERDVFVADRELEEILSSPLIEAVCRDGGGAEAVRAALAMHKEPYELDATDDKGNTG